MANNPDAARRLDLLQLFRGIAALGVVFHHAALSVDAFSGVKLPAVLHEILIYGYLGVDFFFVLSGFIILNSHFDDGEGLLPAKAYIGKRLLRIFPPYLPISILLLVAYELFPHLSAGTRGGDISIVSSLFLLPSESTPALPVAWTLIHEMLFYALFLLFFVGKRLFIAAVCFWAVAIVVLANIDGAPVSNPYFFRFFAAINLEFVIGMICAVLWKRFGADNSRGVLFLGTGLALLFVSIWQLSPGEQNRAVLGLPFALIVLGGAFLSKSRFDTPRIGILLGDASYSIYLVHNPLLSVCSRAVRFFSPYSGWWLMLVTGVIASVILGVAYHSLFEKPVTRFLRSRWGF